MMRFLSVTRFLQSLFAPRSSSPLFSVRRGTSQRIDDSAPTEERSWNPSESNDSGQVLVIGLIVSVGLVLMSLTVANIGMMVSEKIQAQDAADAAAYSAAVTEARYLNLTAYLNRAMIANYDQMAFNTALWASFTSYDHGIAPIISILYAIAGVVQFVPIIGTAIAPVIDNAAYALDISVHNIAHIAASGMSKVFGQDDDRDQVDFNKYLEIYVTDILSTYQGVLYAATQAARYRVIEEVAGKVDPQLSTTTVLGLASEALNEDELKSAVDWVIDEPGDRLMGMGVFNEAFNRVMGEDEDINPDEDDGTGYDREPTLSDDDKLVMLPAMTEASLEKFAAGRDRGGNRNQMRAFNPVNLIGGVVEDVVETALDIGCHATCLIPGTCGCDSDVYITLGSKIIDGHEDCNEQDHVPVFARQRMREVNFFGIDIDLDILTDLLTTIGVPNFIGYTSGQNKTHIRNVDNIVELNDMDEERLFECVTSLGLCSMNILNSTLSGVTTFGVAGITSAASGHDVNDDHWDGFWDEQIACGTRYYNGQVCFDDVGNYISNAGSEGLSDGVPKYDFRTDMNMVGWTHYIYDETDAPNRPEGTSGGDSHNLYSGPTVSVVGVKPVTGISNIGGLGLENEYPITVTSRAQVYYQRNPNRPEERPSTLNPHWSARLAPIDSPETPVMVKDGIPFVTTFGAPMKPTH